MSVTIVMVISEDTNNASVMVIVTKHVIVQQHFVYYLNPLNYSI
jgi:hypothetical protein